MPLGEDVVWHGSNPTFHRMVEYGIVLTSEAIYWFKSPFSFGRWRRIRLQQIHGAAVDKSGISPALCLDVKGTRIRWRTPHDFYADEMQYDERVLAEAAARIGARLSFWRRAECHLTTRSSAAVTDKVPCHGVGVRRDQLRR
jgi:hypothetical protein